MRGSLKKNDKNARTISYDMRGDNVVIEAQYIDSSQVDAYIEAGYTVRFCRFYQFDKVCYLAMREEEE